MKFTIQHLLVILVVASIITTSIHFLHEVTNDDDKEKEATCIALGGSYIISHGDFICIKAGKIKEAK